MRVTCDQCRLLRINGVVCHELGCPNSWKGKTVECRWCGQDFTPESRHQRCCTEDCEQAYSGR